VQKMTVDREQRHAASKLRDHVRRPHFLEKRAHLYSEDRLTVRKNQLSGRNVSLKLVVTPAWPAHHETATQPFGTRSKFVKDTFRFGKITNAHPTGQLTPNFELNSKIQTSVGN